MLLSTYQIPFGGSFTIITKKEDEIIAELLQETAKKRIRWGVQPPSTVQTNINQLHYVLRLRRGVCRLTARRDGGKSTQFIIERKVADEDALTQLYYLAKA